MELVLLSPGSRSVVLDCVNVYQDGECGIIGWSPDGMWVAYYVDDVRSGALPRWSGIYILDGVCVATGGDCSGATHGRILPMTGAAAWSPDGRYLAAGYHGDTRDSIVLFDTNTWAVEKELDVTGHGGPQSLAWSPDGELIAYSTDSYTWVVDVSSGEVTRVRHTYGHEPVVFWIDVPG
jgi:WD40 repeat protein